MPQSLLVCLHCSVEVAHNLGDASYSVFLVLRRNGFDGEMGLSHLSEARLAHLVGLYAAKVFSAPAPGSACVHSLVDGRSSDRDEGGGHLGEMVVDELTSRNGPALLLRP